MVVGHACIPGMPDASDSMIEHLNLQMCAAGVAWSAADPWCFASLSYDGRVVVNRVPGQIKYKILI